MYNVYQVLAGPVKLMYSHFIYNWADEIKGATLRKNHYSNSCTLRALISIHVSYVIKIVHTDIKLCMGNHVSTCSVKIFKLLYAIIGRTE